MRVIVVFYAWQSDRPNNVNRSLVERALEDASKEFNMTSQDIQIVIDQDTKGVSGMPPVSQTILEKIAACDIFLPDLTFVSRFEEGDKKDQLAPNPNVLIEFGYALSKKGHGFLMPVMNTAFGGPGGLPFDMGHLRNPILYCAESTDSDEQRRNERNRLSRELLNALRITIAALRNTNPAPTPRVTSDIRAWASSQHNARMGAIQQLIPVALVSGPKILMHIFPASASDESNEIDFGSVREREQSFMPFGFGRLISLPDAHSWTFYDPPSPDRQGIFPGRFEPSVGQSMWFVELSRYGVVEFISMIDTIGMPNDQGPIGIDGTILEALIVNTIEKIAAALQSLGIQGPAIVQTTLLEVSGCVVLRGARGGGRFSRQPIVLPEAVIDHLVPPLANHLRSVLDAIWRASGIADGSASYRSGAWAGYERSQS